MTMGIHPHASRKRSKYLDSMLGATLSVHKELNGVPDDPDWATNYAADDAAGSKGEPMLRTEVKDILNGLDAMLEGKAQRRVRTEEGAARYKVPIGTLLGANGKPVSAGRNRPGRTVHEVKPRVSEVAVSRQRDGSVIVTQHHGKRGRLATTHQSMSSADAHIDAILDQNEHLISVHHEHNNTMYEVMHNGYVHQGGKRVGRIKPNEKLTTALTRIHEKNRKNERMGGAKKAVQKGVIARRPVLDEEHIMGKRVAKKRARKFVVGTGRAGSGLPPRRKG